MLPPKRFRSRSPPSWRKHDLSEFEVNGEEGNKGIRVRSFAREAPSRIAARWTMTNVKSDLHCTSAVSVFILCWSPYIVFDLLQVYDYVPRTQTNIAVATLIQSLAPLNSAANPIIYCLFSTSFCKTVRWVAETLDVIEILGNIQFWMLEEYTCGYQIGIGNFEYSRNMLNLLSIALGIHVEVSNL